MKRFEDLWKRMVNDLGKTFENHSPSDEVVVLLEEYRSLRQDILERVKNQILIVGVTIALVGASVPLVGRGASLRLILLVAPVLFSATAWLYFEQDIFLIQAAMYLHKALRPQLQRRLSDPTGVLAWESFRHDALFRTTNDRLFLKVMTAFRLLITLGPGVVAVVAAPVLYFTNKVLRENVSKWDIGIYAIGVVAVGFSVYLALRVLVLYGRISDDNDQ